MVKGLPYRLAQCPLACVAEGGVTQVMSQGNGLGEVLVEAQGTGDSTGDLRHLYSVGQAGAVMVPLRGQKNLGLVLQPAEALAMDDAVPVPHEAGAQVIGSFLPLPAQRVFGQGGVGPQKLPFAFLDPFPYRHCHHLSLYKYAKSPVFLFFYEKKWLKPLFTAFFREAPRRCTGGTACRWCCPPALR